MVRTVKSHHHEEEDDDFGSQRTNDGSSQKDGNQKANAHRFQILRDLIPQNDQKRDKASFLLEVIQYIQFLQEKLQMYEGSYPGWSPEPSKLTPWRSNCGTVDSFIDQPQLVKNGSVHEDNIVVTPTLLSNAQNSVDFSGAAPYKEADRGAATQEIPLNMPQQSNLFEGVSAQPPQAFFSGAEHLVSQSQSQYWHGRPCITECAVPSYNPEELKTEKKCIPVYVNASKVRQEEVSASPRALARLLNTLTRALETSGVDLSRSSISVQLDIGKHTNDDMTATKIETKDRGAAGPGNQTMAHYGVGSSGEDFNQAHKRHRTEES
ncbi:hypothetical protein RJ639_023144 [Escallonia herrerae]|uniref:BHLH domain-containing protein n=1 Tax=Escallonia herrerae TaxID=1293975 RepID=A0AA88V1E1_9ASTE|nr:hypothetical protein RJ639_023144 [Escallonia herrerae]